MVLSHRPLSEPWIKNWFITAALLIAFLYCAEAYVPVGPPAMPKPSSPHFSSGPTKKRPGYDLAKLPIDTLGRSHRSSECLGRIQRALELTRDILGIPGEFRLALLPGGGDTGAFEAALWSLVGTKGVPVQALVWEAFGQGWYDDLTTQLKVEEVELVSAPYGELPDLSQVSAGENDVCFVYNGTTSGVCLPDDGAPWIPPSGAGKGRGLTLCDATSACFCMPLPWEKLDVTTFSWQKALGGEGAHGILVLSPRALARLEENGRSGLLAARGIPKLLRLAPDPSTGTVPEGLWTGSTINTPSMLCVEDYLDALQWAQEKGGLPALIARTRANLEAVEAFVAKKPWLSFLASNPRIRSSTSICLRIEGLEEAGSTARGGGSQVRHRLKEMAALMEREGVAYDIASYREAPPGLRIWGGPTVETEDIRRLLPWIEWAYDRVKTTSG
ncbi:phosphoserine aminotransferase [Nannochloropsis gaditana CCMP526]|uniref:Phosphoserine aminotransferase n=1 Tax=Nannochloropsis gaditana TaxID=72520 RepID=W7U8S0_9STRA|nr:phosphoserine aminotransferase [Nannochloropsis gaditana CCMP526]EKU20878.1 phosphoserine aminotransferase [Nannochloropsis gaditana CCMP526]EWM29354.1 phosphoserine aminotransferase [Nannochloropsis gaditana]|eukprot:XP_005855476.1 phosphoserine aminotransferase [Nannochloropsis gaditana CCMP526]